MANGFEELWTLWGRADKSLRSARKPAERVYSRKVRRGADPAAVLSGAKSFLASKATREDGRFMPTLAQWLTQERWNDCSPSAPADRDVYAARRRPGWVNDYVHGRIDWDETFHGPRPTDAEVTLAKRGWGRPSGEPLPMAA